jgi:hypothetical protein
MTLRDDLVRTGYLPENLPPAFSSSLVADHFGASVPGTRLSDRRVGLRPASYSGSKRGGSRRSFAAVHPATAHDLAAFIDERQAELQALFAQSAHSFSLPRHTPGSARAVEIASHSELEEHRFRRLARYRFIAKTDTSRFYHSVYTHSIPWAVHGKAESKSDRNPTSSRIYFNELDLIVRQGQDGQTIGIPVGPDASRYIAEVVAAGIDREFQRRCGVGDVAIVRHVDDVWIGADTHTEAERLLWCYREALREYELDINESKTRIYSDGFQFADSWPAEIGNRLDAALAGQENRRNERLRAALEHAFALAAAERDDGILRYAIRYLDRPTVADWDIWPTFEPFLMRAAVHFGHTLDFIVKILVWRSIVHGDLDPSWEPTLLSALDRHSRLGNDSEVCWILYAALRIQIAIPDPLGENVIRYCGALSSVAMLNVVDAGLANPSLFQAAHESVVADTASGPLWPLFLEWVSRGWPGYEAVSAVASNELIEEMAAARVVLFDPDRLTPVFAGVEDFRSVLRAIEVRGGLYDETENEDDEPNIDLSGLF